MKVERVTASIRYSKEEKSAWKTVELGAEASIDPGGDWFLSQQALYAALTAQLRTVWGQKNGHSPEHAQNGSEKPVEGTWEEIQSYHHPRPRYGLPVPHISARNTKSRLRNSRRTANSGTPTKRRMAGAGSSPH